jgi:hypothetical protein
VSGLKITVSVGAMPSLGTTQISPAKKLRDDSSMSLGTAARPGAVQGPHGEGEGGGAGVGCRQTKDGGDRGRPADDRDRKCPD